MPTSPTYTQSCVETYSPAVVPLLYMSGARGGEALAREAE